MLVYLFAALTALVYLFAMPVRLGAMYRSGRPLQLGVMVGLLRLRYTGGILYAQGAGLELTWRRLGGRGARERRLSLDALLARAQGARQSVEIARTPARFLLGRLRVERLGVNVLVATCDASHTALLQGLLSGAMAFLRTMFPALSLRGRVLASFAQEESTRLDAACIVRLSLGSLLLALLLLLREAASLRLREAHQPRARKNRNSPPQNRT